MNIKAYDKISNTGSLFDLNSKNPPKFKRGQFENSNTEILTKTKIYLTDEYKLVKNFIIIPFSL